MISDHGLFSSYEGQQGAANGQDLWDVFQGYTGLCTAGCSFARRLHQLKASPTMDLGISIFLVFLHNVCPFEKLGLVHQSCLERDSSALLLRTLAVGKRQQSESIEVALDME